MTGSDVYLTGYNLHVQSGSGSTYGAINGKGNLIIGYDESRGTNQDVRTGSHNLILGTKNNYSGYGGLVAGADNGITGGYTTITGGSGNRALGTYSSVSGGQNVTASAAYDLEPEASAVTGLQSQLTAQGKITGLFSLSTDTTRTDGLTNTELSLTGVNLHVLNGMGSTETQNGLGNLIVGYNELRGDGTDERGGSHNIVTGILNNYGSSGGLLGGYDNSLTNVEQFAVGAVNTVSGHQSAVSGGRDNATSADYASVSGGQDNTASGYAASVSGGEGNTASADYASVSGGQSNTASSDHSSVSGGAANTASGTNSPGYTVASWVGGGISNTAGAPYASVCGGQSLTQSNFEGWSGGSYHTP